MQQLLFVGEIVVILLFAVLAFAKLGDVDTSINPAFSWFNPFTVDLGVLAQGVLLGLFIYWGWDTGRLDQRGDREQPRDSRTAAVASTFILLAIYSWSAPPLRRTRAGRNRRSGCV